MRMFMVKAYMSAAIMLISVLVGMQLANDGIHKLKGYDDANFQNAFAFMNGDGCFRPPFWE